MEQTYEECTLGVVKIVLIAQEEPVHDLLSKEIGGIVEKYSVAIKKKTEHRFLLVVYYLQEVSR
jgi:hypothetical protein